MDTMLLEHSPSTTSVATHSKCHILELPAELRNRVYEMTFCFSAEAEVDLACPSPPSKALLQACRQMYKEARLIYQEAYRAFWCSQTFVLLPLLADKQPGGCNELFDALENLNTQDLRSITKVKVYCNALPDGDFWGLDQGLWLERSADVPRMRTFRLMVPPAKDERMIMRGYRPQESRYTKWFHLPCAAQDDSDTEEAKQLLGRPGLELEEILAAMRTVLSIPV